MAVNYYPLRLIESIMEASQGITKSNEEATNPLDYEQYKRAYKQKYGLKLPEDRDAFIEQFSIFGEDIDNTEEYMKVLAGDVLEELMSVGYDPNKNKATCTADIKDFLLYGIILGKWAQNKQVYKPDADFAEALLKTKNFSLSRNEVEHLPVNTIFVDLTDIECTGNYMGMIINVIPREKDVIFDMYLLDNTYSFFSHYLKLEYDKDDMLTDAIMGVISNKDNNEIITRTGDVEMMDLSEALVVNDTYIINRYAKNHFVMSRLELLKLALQLIVFMTSDEPDINESAITKSTYRKPTSNTKPKNKFSEVSIKDVGVKYGTAIRKSVEQAKKEAESEDKEHRTIKNRKSPVPHFRCAHWQRFWTGRGRTVPINKWIEPTFVGFDLVEESKKSNSNVIIHEVNK